MTLSRATDLGTISVSDMFFAQIILDSFQQESLEHKVWPSTKKGRQIGNDQKVNLSDFANHIEVESGLDGERLDIEFSIIVKFGVSIRKLTEDLADYIAKAIAEKQGKYPNQIKIRITGVRSKQVAKRSLEVIKNYAVK